MSIGIRDRRSKVDCTGAVLHGVVEELDDSCSSFVRESEGSRTSAFKRPFDYLLLHFGKVALGDREIRVNRIDCAGWIRSAVELACTTLPTSTRRAPALPSIGE